MNSREFLDIQSIWQHSVWFPLEKVLALKRRDMRDGSKDVCRVSCRSLDAVSMIDPTFTSLRIHIKMMEVVIEVNRARAEIPSEEGRMGGEDSRQIHVSLFGQREGNPGEPFMEMGDNGTASLVSDKLDIHQLAADR